MSKSSVFFCLSLVLTIALNAKPVRNGAVEAELISAVTSIQPGNPFTVALRLRHDPHWHTYWIHPGTGLATSLAWALPTGFRASAIEWPVPQIFLDPEGKPTGYGFTGETFLLVQITPPPNLAPGTDVTLRAHAEWLMCQEVCMPGQAELTLTLPVSATQPVPDKALVEQFAGATRRLPTNLPKGWSAEARRQGDVVRLRLEVGPGPRPLPTTLYFFSESDLIDYEQPQVVHATPHGYDFRLKTAESADPKTDRLMGVIRAEGGWSIDSASTGSIPSQGIRVDVPLRP